jgi:hypothetical protein
MASPLLLYRLTSGSDRHQQHREGERRPSVDQQDDRENERSYRDRDEEGDEIEATYHDPPPPPPAPPPTQPPM